MEWWLIDLAAVVGLVAGGRVIMTRRRTHRAAGEELAGVRRLADEDVTQFGEELSRFDGAVDRLDEAGRLDYQKALDSYESAQRAAPRMRDVDEISTVSDTLSQGRYALACVDARLQGLPVPPYRVPCFFNPQHGRSTEDVLYTPPGRGTRTVPACAQDAARVRQGERPDVRTVTIGARKVPYWEAGSTYLDAGLLRRRRRDRRRVARVGVRPDARRGRGRWLRARRAWRSRWLRRVRR